MIEPLLAVLLRPMVGIDAGSAGEALASREITVVADKSLPYDVVKKVMTTCTEAAYGRISLAVIEKEQAGERASQRPEARVSVHPLPAQVNSWNP